MFHFNTTSQHPEDTHRSSGHMPNPQYHRTPQIHEQRHSTRSHPATSSSSHDMSHYQQYTQPSPYMAPPRTAAPPPQPNPDYMRQASALQAIKAGALDRPIPQAASQVPMDTILEEFRLLRKKMDAMGKRISRLETFPTSDVGTELQALRDRVKQLERGQMATEQALPELRAESLGAARRLVGQDRDEVSSMRLSLLKAQQQLEDMQMSMQTMRLQMEKQDNPRVTRLEAMVELLKELVGEKKEDQA
eukprot:gnl/Dysnectes_brevis/10399_a20553_129.p1 GENE.gnl/Dysnectes_brevis/10399_a20553_129~~gnl/Dysnectes_brevis/10399_a20553_129.p1  ORF type:complete len:247 (-),score=97.51 gnl/Dysnectes_brevis/10399_a20553_129:79-819(-)